MVARAPGLPAQASWLQAARKPVWMRTARAQKELGWKPKHTARSTLLQMTEYGGLRYASDSAIMNLERRRTPLACYVTTAEDYAHAVHAPVIQR